MYSATKLIKLVYSIQTQPNTTRYLCIQRFADCRWAGFSAQKFVRRTELSATTKLCAEHETPPIANVLLAVRFYFHLCLPNIF